MNRREFVHAAFGATTLSVALPAFTEQTRDPEAIAYYLDSSVGSEASFPIKSILSACAKKEITLRQVTAIDGFHSGLCFVFCCGVHEASSAGRLATELGATLPTATESFAVYRSVHSGADIVLVGGGGPLGLAYGLYALLDAIETSDSLAAALRAYPDRIEAPAVRDRSLSTYTMQQAYFESRLFDERFWDLYLNNLVRNRFNNFSLLLAYESSGYLAPPYPWFFDLPGFPEVKAVGVTSQDQQRYIGGLNRLIEMAHERGLKFTLGVWDHIYDGHSSYYTKGVWDHLPMVDGRRPKWPVEGLTDKNLVAYTAPALTRFLELVPHIDTIQFRMHGESGLNKAGLSNFWVPIFKVMASTNPKIRFDARAKEFPLDLAAQAIDLGVNLRLTTKYCAEQVAMPFHAMHLQHVDQFGTRTSYFDMLRYPQRYHVQWRLWTSGSLRILSWGGMNYAKRFAESTHLYDGDGFEVSEPLATKMASMPHNAAPLPLLNPPYRFYDYEFQRYWAYFYAFGRSGYGVADGDDSLARLFALHYGIAAGLHLRHALEQASEIVPRIVAYSSPLSKFPTTRGWPERQRWEDLPEYTAAEPSDVALFASFDEETALALNGGTTAKIRMADTANWFATRRDEVLVSAKKAESLAPKPLSKEMQCTLTDLRILAHLAAYHERRIHAGLAYSLYRRGGDLFALDNAISREEEALTAWRDVVASAGDVYVRKLAMGLQIDGTPVHEPGDLSGHWLDEIAKLELGLKKLRQERDGFHPGRRFVASYVLDAASAEANERLMPHSRVFNIELPSGRYALELEARQDYNHDDRVFGPMWIEANGIDRTPTFTVPAGETHFAELMTEVRDGRLTILLGNQAMSEAILTRMRVFRVENVLAHTPLRIMPNGAVIVLKATVSGQTSIKAVEAVWITSAGQQATHAMQPVGPYRYTASFPVSVPSSYFLRATDDAGVSFLCPPEGAATAIHVTRKTTSEAPEFLHTPVADCQPGKPISVHAKVRSSHGIRSVALRYRSVSQFQDYFHLEMTVAPESDEYHAEIPGNRVVYEWDFMYYFEIFDNAGRGWIRPDAERETPYIVVKLKRH